MTPARNKIESIAEMIADHIAEARNYAATLESICNRAATDRALLLHHSHFFATIKTALWQAMILHLHHCLDRRREALGFHALLKHIRASFPEEGSSIRKIDQRYQALRAKEEAKAVGRWRSEMVAHAAHDHKSYGQFVKDVPCDFRDVECLLAGCEDLLDTCRRTFPDVRIPKVLSFHAGAEPSIASVMEALWMANTASHGTLASSRP